MEQIETKISYLRLDLSLLTQTEQIRKLVKFMRERDQYRVSRFIDIPNKDKRHCLGVPVAKGWEITAKTMDGSRIFNLAPNSYHRIEFTVDFYRGGSVQFAREIMALLPDANWIIGEV